MARRNRPQAQNTNKAVDPLDTLLESPEGAWRSARMLAGEVFWTFAPAIRALMPRFFNEEEAAKAGIATMAVDQHYRCYINEAFTLRLIADAQAVTKDAPCAVCGAHEHHDLAYVAGVICHEAQHPVRTHGPRAEEVFAEHRLWNVAADCEINDDLLEIFTTAYQEAVHSNTPRPQLCLPPGVVLPKDFRTAKFAKYNIPFPDDQIAEVYYYKLLDMRDAFQADPDVPDSEKQGPNGSGGQGQGEGKGDGQPGQGGGQGNGNPFDNNGQDCGSGAHGNVADYEDDSPGPGTPGISDAENRHIQKEIAKELKKASATRGNIPAGMTRWADEVLTPPKVNWRQHFKRLVRNAITFKPGHDVTTYRRMGRATAATGYSIPFPSTQTPQPRIGVVLDTSGSMGYGKDSPLYEAWCEVEGICKQLNALVSFCAVDAAAGKIQEISSFKEAALQGGGGTDMRVGIAAMEKQKNPVQVVVVLTDGYTPWPTRAPRNMAIVAALCGGDGAAADVPSFIKTVLVEVKK